MHCALTTVAIEMALRNLQKSKKTEKNEP